MGVTPYLYYEDVGRALEFLRKAFGFRAHGVKRRGPDGQVVHAAMKCGGALIMMGRPPAEYRNPRRLGQATQSLDISVKGGIAEHFRRARAAGAAVLEEPAPTEYGHLRYGVTDPEGHEWYFAQAIRRRRKGRAAPK